MEFVVHVMQLMSLKALTVCQSGFLFVYVEAGYVTEECCNIILSQQLKVQSVKSCRVKQLPVTVSK